MQNKIMCYWLLTKGCVRVVNSARRWIWKWMWYYVFFSPFSDFLLKKLSQVGMKQYMSFNTYIKISLICFIPLWIGDFCNGWKLRYIAADPIYRRISSVGWTLITNPWLDHNLVTDVFFAFLSAELGEISPFCFLVANFVLIFA